MIQAFKAPLFAVLASAALLSGCGQSTLDFRNADISNGKIYKAGADSGFSGKVTNVPLLKIVSASPSGPFARIMELTRATLGMEALEKTRIHFSVVCDAPVDDGIVDGEVTCTNAPNPDKRYTLHYKDGQLHGALKIFDGRSDDHVIVAADLSDNALNGKLEIFSPKTYKVLRRSEWSKGVPEAEDGFDENTGEKTVFARYRNGKLHGKYAVYAPDGKLAITEAFYVDGQLDGVEQHIDPKTGRMLKRVEWKMGKREGKWQEWGADGKPTVDQLYADDQPVAIPQATSPQLASAPAAVSPSAAPSGGDAQCVERWINTHRKVHGEDEIVTADQMGEWEALCRQGKTPG